MRRDELGPLARKAAVIENQRSLQNFDRFNQDFSEAYNLDLRLKKMPER
jgi:hypothetical protein